MDFFSQVSNFILQLAIPTFRRIRTRDCHNVRFYFARDFMVAVLLLLAIQRKLQALFDEPLCYAANGANTHSVRFAYFLKLPWLVVIGLVQLQQNLCMLDLLR